MLNDMIVNFKKYYGKYGDVPILKNYKLKQGLYFKLNINNGIKDMLLIKEGARDEDISQKDIELYSWFKQRDFISILNNYDTNKRISSKSIHSSNYLTLFFKKGSLIKDDKIDEQFKIDIKKYFDVFNAWMNIEDYVKQNDKAAADPIKGILLETPMADYDLYKSSINAIYQSIDTLYALDEVKNEDKDDYIRIFIDADMDIYESEYKRYMVHKANNKDIYHTYINGSVHVLPNCDMGTNPKKPSLLLNTMKCQVPIRYSVDDIILEQKLFWFLWFYNITVKDKKTGQYLKKHSIYKTLYIPYDWEFDEDTDLTKYAKYNKPMFYVKTGNGTSFNIVDFDVIPPFNIDINFDIQDLFNIPVEEENETLHYEVKTIYNLEYLINYHFFNNELVKNYFTVNIAAYSLPINLVNIIYTTRSLFYNWFRKGCSNDIKDSIDSITMEIINIWIKNIYNDKNSIFRVKHSLNIYFALMKYFNKETPTYMDIKILHEKIRNDIYSKNNKIESDEEFYYLAGQLVYYLTTLSEAKEKKQSMINTFIDCKSTNILKDNLTELYTKYNYKMSIYDTRFKNGFSLLMSYEPEGSFKTFRSIFLTGLLSDNVMYQKKNNNIKGSVVNYGNAK